MEEQMFEVKEGQKLVLEIGGQPKPLAHMVPGLEDAKIVHLNIDPELKPDILMDAGDIDPKIFGKFDVVFASHVLEHFSYWKTDSVLKGWKSCLKPGGELHVLVPSLEWAAREVLSETPSPAVYAQLYAGQVNEWDVHLTGFTMRKLRQLFEQLDLNVHTARTGIYHVRVGSFGDVEAHQHYVVGLHGNPSIRSSNGKHTDVTKDG